jgi:hypothetical protein
MKNLLFITLAFISFQNLSFANTLEWGDLETNSRYLLNQTITFPGIAEFKIGDKFDVLDSINESGPVMYYQMHLVNCQNPDLTADMILVNPSPNDTTRDRSVGIQLEAGCNLGIFLEPRDFYSPSLFDE